MAIITLFYRREFRRKKKNGGKEVIILQLFTKNYSLESLMRLLQQSETETFWAKNNVLLAELCSDQDLGSNKMLQNVVSGAN